MAGQPVSAADVLKLPAAPQWATLLYVAGTSEEQQQPLQGQQQGHLPGQQQLLARKSPRVMMAGEVTLELSLLQKVQRQVGPTGWPCCCWGWGWSVNPGWQWAAACSGSKAL